MSKLNVSAEHWIFERELGSGGYGTVELWKNKSFNKKIAVKRCIMNGIKFTPKQKERWKNEVDILKLLNHRNIIATVPEPAELQNNSDNALPILCMEYCAKGDLRMVLNKAENSCGIFEQEALIIIGDISSAVQYLHKNKITHRDLKPENIVLHNYSDKTVYKLIDLGYAKELDETSMYASLVGTLNYVAPELFWNKKYSCTVDYWSLGILFYEVLTGKKPFLPNQKNTMTWLKHIQNKKYEYICADENNNTVIFYEDIQNPVSISYCIRQEIVEWFRVVLQWDPKQRGKLPNTTVNNEVVVFSLLKKILSKKILYVFILPLYKIVSYSILPDTTFESLKEWIKKDSKISANLLTLTDSQGNVLDSTKSYVFSQLKESEQFMIAFQNGDSQINVSALQLPKFVKLILSQCNTEITHQVKRQCYGEAIFLIKQEIDLFRWYIIALSIRIDLIYARFNVLNEKMSKSTSNTNFFISYVNQVLEKNEIKATSLNREESIEDVFKKIMTLSDAIDQMKKKLDELKGSSENLRKFCEINWMENNTKMYNKAIEMFDTLKNKKNCSQNEMKEMTILIVKFIKLREEQLQNSTLVIFTEQICKIETELSKLEQSLKSVAALEKVYCQEIKNLKKTKTSNVTNMLQSNEETTSSSDFNHSPITEGDNVIYDNLLLQQMLKNLIDNMNKKVTTLNL